MGDIPPCNLSKLTELTNISLLRVIKYNVCEYVHCWVRILANNKGKYSES